MKKYKVKMTFSFTGEVEVRAENKFKAYEMAEKHFGNTLGPISFSVSSETENEEGVVDWNFPVHPKKKIHKITL